ncbi:hypothetical protein J6590_036424 [Homalodisca vitripennis]|nr:hypothetical protein J6590_036424 [Homalodisca vitripennis]
MTLNVRKSLVGLSKVSDPLPSVGDNDLKETDEADIHESTSDAIYQQSPFYKDMKAIETEVHTLLNIKEPPKEDEPNSKVFENLNSADANKNETSEDSTTHHSASRTENIYYSPKMANLIINNNILNFNINIHHTCPYGQVCYFKYLQRMFVQKA